MRSPSDRRRDVIEKVHEYLQAGVGVVCVVDDATREVRVFDERGVHALGGDANLEFPGVLPGFSVIVRRLFD